MGSAMPSSECSARFLPGRQHDLWIPLALDRTNPAESPARNYLQRHRRLKPGVTQGQVSAKWTASRRNSSGKIQRPISRRAAGACLWFRSKTRLSGSIRPRFLVLLGAVGFVLLFVRQRGKSSSGPSFSPRKRTLHRTAMGARTPLASCANS